MTRVNKCRFLKSFLFRCVLRGSSHPSRPLNHTHSLDVGIPESSWHCPRETLSVRHPTVFLPSPKYNQVFLLFPTEDADVDGGSTIMHLYLVWLHIVASTSRASSSEGRGTPISPFIHFCHSPFRPQGATAGEWPESLCWAPRGASQPAVGVCV